MKIETGVNRIGSFDLEATRRVAQQEGYAVFVFPATGILNQAAFFEAVRATLPLDPPVVSNYGWDALSDSLREGLYRHSAQRIAILWSKSQSMATSAPADFELAVGLLEEVSNMLADSRATCDKPKEVAVLIE